MHLGQNSLENGPPKVFQSFLPLASRRERCHIWNYLYTNIYIPSFRKKYISCVYQTSMLGIPCSIHHSHLLGNSRYVVVECCCGEQVDVVKLVCLRYRTGLLTFSCTCCPQKQPRVFGTMFWRPKERVMSRKTPVQPMVEFFEIHQSPKLGSLWQSYESNDGFWII